MMANSNRSRPSKSTPLAFFGTADFSAPSLRGLITAGFNIAVVITKPDTRQGRGRSLSPPAVKTIALEHDLPLIQPPDKAALSAALTDFTGVTTGIVVAYGMILPPIVLDHFSSGLVNVHASLLPRWRGPSPIEAAILEGDTETGVTLMSLAPAMDSGPIYTQAHLPLSDAETKPELYKSLAELGSQVLTQALPDILEGELTPEPQDEAAVTYCPLIQKNDGLIDWQQPAEQIARQIRAYLGWPGSRTEINATTVTITTAHPINLSGAPGEFLVTETGELLVYCQTGALIIDRLIPAGKREMSGQDFARGHLTRPI